MHLGRAFEASQSLSGPQAGALGELTSDVQEIVQQALPLQRMLDDGADFRPTRDDIRSVRAAGWPWKSVAEVAEVFLTVERGGADALARRLLRPEGFPETIFQLGVLGGILNACEQEGGSVSSIRPIGYMTDGPVYRVDWADMPPWDVWCEAAAAWSWYGVDDTYRELAATMTYAGGGAFSARNIRPDIIVAAPDRSVAVLECKYPAESLDPGYVAHGLYQAAFYGHQLAPAFADVFGASIGPTELVQGINLKMMGELRVGLLGAGKVGDVVSWLRQSSGSPVDTAVAL